MGEDVLSLTGNWLTAVGLTYFSGHAIADDGDVVGRRSHCSNVILGPRSKL